MFYQEPEIIKNALHGEFKDIVMSTFETHMAMKGFAHGDDKREFKERDSSVRYIMRRKPQHRGIELLEKWIYDIIEEPIYTPEIIQITTYNEGEYYNWHKDGSGFGYRKLSLTMQLNDPSEYEGGEFEFKDFGVMKMEKGDACLFAPNLMHRVKPVTKGVRHSVVSWFILRELGDIPTKELHAMHAKHT